MPKQLLTLEQLVKFCSENKFYNFSSQDSGYTLAVQVPATFSVDDTQDDSHRGMTKLKFRIFHTGLNRNGSFVSKESAEKAMSTISDRPILAAIHQLDDGSWDFEGHEMELIENENGEPDVNYIEKQVGSFSSETPFWEHDDELDKDYVCAYGYISDNYTKASEIITAKGGTKNSVELCIESMSFNAKDKCLELNDFFVSGSTLLGSRCDGTEIGEGMLGSRADIADFSSQNNSVIYKQNNEVEKVLENEISNLNINTTRKEEEQVADTQNMETIEEIVIEEEVTEPAIEVEEVNEEVTETPSEEVVLNEEEIVEDAPEELVVENSLTYSLSVDGEVKTYSVSLADKMNAISVLVNDTYSELDNDWYYCDVYEEESYVVMHGWSGSYRQSFKCKKDKYSLVGDRVRVYAQYLTEDEISALENMKSKYSEISEKLDKYEAEPEKIKILESDDYSQIRETKAFVELKEQKNHFDLSVEEVAKKADEILLAYAKNTKIEFSVKPEEPKNNASFVMFGVSERNGSSFLDNLLNK